MPGHRPVTLALSPRVLGGSRPSRLGMG